MPSFSVEDMWRVIAVVVILVIHYLGILGKVDTVKSQVELVRGDMARNQRDLAEVKAMQAGYVTAAQLASGNNVEDEVHRRLEARDQELQRGLDRLQNRVDSIELRQENRRR